MKPQRHMTHFSPVGQPKFITVDIPDPLHRTHNGNQLVYILIDRYSATTLFDNCIITYGIPSFLMTASCPQFTARLFEKFCLDSKAKPVTKTVYHLQTNGQLERCDKTVVAPLRHYISDYQNDWDEHIQALTYAYNMEVTRSTKTSPSLFLSFRDNSYRYQVW